MRNDDLPTTLRGVALRAIDLAGVAGGRELARVSEERGAKVSHGTLNGLITGTYNSRPSDELLRKLSVLAEMTLEDVRAAARVPNPGAPFADELPEEVDYIVGTPRKILLDAIRLFAQQGRRTAELEAELEELRNDARSTPIKEAGSGRPLHPVALVLLDVCNWEPHDAVKLANSLPDTADSADAAEDIRSLIEVTPQELLAARRSRRHPPQGPQAQSGD